MLSRVRWQASRPSGASSPTASSSPAPEPNPLVRESGTEGPDVVSHHIGIGARRPTRLRQRIRVDFTPNPGTGFSRNLLDQSIIRDILNKDSRNALCLDLANDPGDVLCRGFGLG